MQMSSFFIKWRIVIWYTLCSVNFFFACHLAIAIHGNVLYKKVSCTDILIVLYTILPAVTMFLRHTTDFTNEISRRRRHLGFLILVTISRFPCTQVLEFQNEISELQNLYNNNLEFYHQYMRVVRFITCCDQRP